MNGEAPAVVTGYHGTSLSAAHAILSTGFRASANDYDWLGDGVYFVEDSAELAWDWAVKHHHTEAAVLRARIELRDCMDFKTDREWASFIARVHDLLIERSRAAGIPLPRQTAGAHRTDRAVINLAADILSQSGQAIRVVRGIFAEGRPAFPGSFLSDLAHVQIAVRDTALIYDSEIVPRPASAMGGGLAELLPGSAADPGSL